MPLKFCASLYHIVILVLNAVVYIVFDQEVNISCEGGEGRS
jgi:hypothetical protein